MQLKVVFGRSGSGKSYYCLNSIKESLESQKVMPLLIVPEQFSLLAEKSLIDVIGRGGLINTEVLTFKRLAHRVFAEVGGLTKKSVDKAGRSMLLYNVIEDLKENLKVFSRVADRPGFINVISQTISEFKRYTKRPENLNEITKKVESGLLRYKLEDISAIYEAFDKKLHQEYVDSDDILNLLSERIKQSKWLRKAEIYIDQFNGFTPQEFEIIKCLLQNECNITIALPLDDIKKQGHFGALFQPIKRVVLKLENLAGDLQCPFETVDLNGISLKRFENNPELSHLENNLFAYPYKTYNFEVENINITACLNPYSEVEEIARNIVSLIRDSGFRFRDIAVVGRDMSAYEQLIEIIFRQFDIPYFLDRKREIDNHPFITLVLSCIEIFTTNWSYESVFRYLKTGMSKIEQNETDILENYVLAWGIRGSTWTSEKDWCVGFDTEKPEEAALKAKINCIRQKVILPLIEFRSKAKGRKTAVEFCTALYDFVLECGATERLKNAIEDFTRKGMLDEARLFQQIWGVFTSVLDQIVEVCKNQKINLKRFYNLLKIGFSEYKLGIIPPSIDQVLIGSIERSKSHNIKALFVLGVNDGIFPSNSFTEGILSDREREALMEMDFELAKDTRSKAIEEQFMVYSTLTTPQDCLYVSYSASDSQGKALRQSSIIIRLKRIFPKLIEKSFIVDRDLQYSYSAISMPSPTFLKLIEVLRISGNINKMQNHWLIAWKWFEASLEWDSRIKMIKEALNYTNQVPSLNSSVSSELFGQPMYSSVSRLEKYSACPFSFFIQYGLKAGERKIFTIEAPDIGSFMHEAIERFSKAVTQRGYKWKKLTKEDCRRLTAEIVQQMLESWSFSAFFSTARYKYLIKRLTRVLSRSLWLVTLHLQRSNFEPLGYELTFGKEGIFPPITVELPSGQKVLLNGKIDRLDYLETEEGTYVRVIDYKSGSKSLDLTEIYYGIQIQLLAYLWAVWDNGGSKLKRPLLPAGVFYMKLDDPMITSNTQLDDETIEQEILKKLKLNGLILSDLSIIRQMDTKMDSKSEILPVALNKSGELSKNSSSANRKEFELLRDHVDRLLVKICEDISKGYIGIEPYKLKGKTSCDYCGYKGICGFDTRIPGNRQRILKSMKPEEFWDLLDKKQGINF